MVSSLLSQVIVFVGHSRNFEMLLTPFLPSPDLQAKGFVRSEVPTCLWLNSLSLTDLAFYPWVQASWPYWFKPSSCPHSPSFRCQQKVCATSVVLQGDKAESRCSFSSSSTTAKASGFSLGKCLNTMKTGADLCAGATCWMVFPACPCQHSNE